MSPRVFGNLVATTLYEKRFGPYFSEPVIAGKFSTLSLPPAIFCPYSPAFDTELEENGQLIIRKKKKTLIV